MELQVTCQEKDLKKDTLLDIQKKLAKGLKTKREVQTINQVNNKPRKCFLTGSAKEAC